MSRTRPQRGARRTSQDRAHRTSLVMSVLLALVGIIAVGIGSYAWSQPRPAPVQITGSGEHAIARTPPFDSGVTLFGSEARVPEQGGARWGCRLRQDGGSRELGQRADIEQTGTRVHGDEALLPALAVGITESGATIRCTDVPEGVQVWVLPTEVGARRVPLALVVGGIGGLGLAVLVHPRTRGLVRFT